MCIIPSFLTIQAISSIALGVPYEDCLEYVLDENGAVEYNGNKYSLVTELVIPEGVTEIGANAFRYCTALTSVTFSDTTKKWTITDNKKLFYIFPFFLRIIKINYCTASIGK